MLKKFEKYFKCNLRDDGHKINIIYYVIENPEQADCSL